MLGIILCGSVPSSRSEVSATEKQLAKKILADPDLPIVLERARALLKTGLSAGSGYGEVWIRDLNTFIELSVEVNDREIIRSALLNFFRFQAKNGDVPDGYIPKEKANVAYKYRQSDSAPALLAHKNTVETDQESSLVQAVSKYVRVTGDKGFLQEQIGGQTVLRRLELALEYLLNERFEPKYGLIWGATTADWGDVQPEHPWGVELDESSHRAIDIYDNAMFLIAINQYIRLAEASSTDAQRWRRAGETLKAQVRKHLWDAKAQKFIPHLYLAGSPFPESFKENELYYHGGTAVAVEAGILNPEEILASLRHMRENVRKAGASSIGLTIYPPYPAGFFKNPVMVPYGYQNGGDWCWFGGRMIQALIEYGWVAEAYTEVKPMLTRVRQHGDFYEYWSLDNKPRGSAQYRGSAGVLGKAVVMLLSWAELHKDAAPAELP